MKILVVNCGSSSLKYQLIDMDNDEVLCKGLVERIGMQNAVLTHQKPGMDKYIVEQPMETHTTAIQLVLDALVDPVHGVVSNMNEIGAVGHRVLHGGEKFTESCLVDEACKEAIKE